MIDFNTPIGQKIEKRLRQEKMIWLTSVDAHNKPQPRPVWFDWDGETVLIFSQETGAKLRHIAANPHVALNFNTNAHGGDVGVLIGEAQVLHSPPPVERLKSYLGKYQEDIKSLGSDPETVAKEFDVVILVTPSTLRGF